MASDLSEKIEMRTTLTLRTLLLTFALLLCAGAAFAGSICPAGAPPNPFPHTPDGAATGCNVVITIAANNSASTVVRDATAYENSEDVLIGVQNNSSAPISSLTLTGTGIFGFESDGICIYTFVGSSYCNASQIAGTDPQDYQGPTSTFATSSPNSGTVLFNPPIPPGGSSYFSLEGVPTANLQIVIGPPAVPAPSTIMLLGVGFAAMIVFLFFTRRSAASAS
jgi:hypothetical protein